MFIYSLRAEPIQLTCVAAFDRDVNETLRSETETRPRHLVFRPRRDRDVYFSGPRRDQDRDLASRDRDVVRDLLVRYRQYSDIFIIAYLSFTILIL